MAPVLAELPVPVTELTFGDPPAGLKLHAGAQMVAQGTVREIEFTLAAQYATLPFSRKLDRVAGAMVTAWVYPRRSGEQNFCVRGEVTIDPLGNWLFRGEKTYVNFLLGTDRHGRWRKRTRPRLRKSMRHWTRRASAAMYGTPAITISRPTPGRWPPKWFARHLKQP